MPFFSRLCRSFAPALYTSSLKRRETPKTRVFIFLKRTFQNRNSLGINVLRVLYVGRGG